MDFDTEKLSRHQKNRGALAVNVLAWALFVSACAPSSESSPEAAGNGADSQPKRETAAEPGARDAAKLMQLQEQLAFARHDLAQRLKAPLDSVEISSARPVTWRSGALGCPRPDRAYTQALVPGVQILLRVGDELFAYHAAVGKQPFSCPLDRAELPVYSKDSDQI